MIFRSMKINPRRPIVIGSLTWIPYVILGDATAGKHGQVNRRILGRRVALSGGELLRRGHVSRLP